MKSKKPFFLYSKIEICSDNNERKMIAQLIEFFLRKSIELMAPF